MEQFWETLRQIGTDFVQNTGLAIVRTVAFLVLGLVIVKIVRIIAQSTAYKSKLDNAASTFVVSLVTVILYIALAIVVVSSLGFSTAGIIAAFSAVALAVALALKDSLGSLANGVILIFTKPFKKGDFIAVDGMEGTVQDIRLFNTKILTPNNEEIIIPNSEVLGNKLVNYTTMPLRRVVIAFPVPYDSDIDAVREIILGCATAHPLAVASPAPAVVLDAYDSSAVRLSVRVWTLNENYWTVTNELKEILFNTLRDKGIEIPFDRLDVQLIGEGGKKA